MRDVSRYAKKKLRRGAVRVVRHYRRSKGADKLVLKMLPIAGVFALGMAIGISADKIAGVLTTDE